ncbi:hypothetical protein F4781DRAFT_415799 [Annulohypoxylon bovei var. microspora]|nr:hypothetical protein F4781DRAFT_415799 [Annulohypoxylon bovei var. microspora]
MARRSARLASASKGVIPSSVPQLGSVPEVNENSAIHPESAIKRLDTIASSPMPRSTTQPATPAVATPVKLPMSEMHPSKVHPTTAAPSSGLKLGFSDIDFNKNTPHAPGMTQSTPSKTPLPVPSTEFTFRYSKLNGAGGADLSQAAKKMRGEIRQDMDFKKIYVDLAAERDQEKQQEADLRKVRPAKGKAGRFSAAHMAEFKKMDSIENHPAAFRSAGTTSTPMKSGIKRTRSKANLNEPDSLRSKKSFSRLAPSSPEKPQEEPASPIKRVKQRLDDDVSTFRPVSRDGSFIPRPKSSGNDSVRGVARSHNLMTPTKSSLARLASAKTPTKTLTKSQSKPDLDDFGKTPSKPTLASLARASTKKGLSGLKMSVFPSSLGVDKHPNRVQTPGRFDRVKSILKRQISGSKPRSSIPQLVASPSKTPTHQGIDEGVLQAPLTTPARKLERHVGFTPIAKQPTGPVNSPSPVKSSIPRSKAMVQFQSGSSTTGKSGGKKTSEGEVAYPDLSAYCRDVNGDTEMSEGANLPESVPGTFTFRIDHTIRFDSDSPTGFGAAAGQASLRHIRDSVLPTNRMPGSFPRPSDVSPNKENNIPPVGPGIPHGMSNKKRHRATWDDEEDDSDRRVTKKLRKNPAPEGHEVVAPRLLGRESPAKKSTGTPRTPSPQKKAGSLSLSRLNMLAKPKLRK